MRAVIVAAGLAFVLSLFGTPFAIRGFTRLKAGQPIRDINVSHAGKRGTPTMGGVVFIVGTVVAYLAGHVVLATLPDRVVAHPPGMSITALILLGLMLTCGLIGFWDDFLKVRKRNSTGLSGKGKLIAQAVVGGAFGVLALYAQGGARTTTGSTDISFVRDVDWLNIGRIAAVILFVIVVIMTTNAVNLTDGLDGLATGASVMVLAAYLLISFWQYRHWCYDVHAPSYTAAYCYQVRDPLETGLIAGAAAGACLGFLWWNASPARIFMGDTGSMALGGLIAGMALATRTVLLLPIIGLLFVIIALSLVIQVVSFRTTGRRVFRMSPLHHHFELAGWSEVNIVIRFWIIAGIGVVVGLGLFFGDFLRVVS
jgi:phospho-N-acetylmuramoyl-pentapeptide-transferase